MIPLLPTSTLFPYTTLFRSHSVAVQSQALFAEACRMALLVSLDRHCLLHLSYVGCRDHAGADVARLHPQGFLEYSFVETTEAMHPMYVIRSLGGAMFVAGALIMAFNFYKTLTPRT